MNNFDEQNSNQEGEGNLSRQYTLAQVERGVPYALVIGSPIAHSLSPVLHQAAYRQLGLDYNYYRVEAKPQDLGRLLESLPPGCLGLSITMPCKKAMLSHADWVDAEARRVGGVNTLVFEAKTGRRLGYSTDGMGMRKALLEAKATGSAEHQGPDRVRTTDTTAAGESLGLSPTDLALILGTGDTASVALVCLSDLSVSETVVVGRNFGPTSAIVQTAKRNQLKIKTLQWSQREQINQYLQVAKVVISTVPAEVADQLVGDGADPEVNPGAIYLDVTYSKHQRKLMQQFARAGSKFASPLVMLTYQGVEQVRLMLGQSVDPHRVYDQVVLRGGA